MLNLSFSMLVAFLALVSIKVPEWFITSRQGPFMFLAGEWVVHRRAARWQECRNFTAGEWVVQRRATRWQASC